MKLFKNCKISKLKIALTMLFCLCFFIMPKCAEAGLILQVPSSLGLSTGLVGHWTFDNKDIYNTTVLDKSGNGNNGTNNGATKTIGKLGQALSFDGNANNVSISHGSSLELGLEDFTVSLWIKSDILATKQVIIDKTDGTTGFRLITSDTDADRLKFIRGALFANGVHSNDAVLKTNKWQHVVVVVDTTGTDTTYYYVDAVAQGSSATHNTSAFTTNVMKFGEKSYTSSTAVNFNGLIDDVRVYNRALSEKEIQRLYNIGTGLKISGSQNQVISPLNEGLVGHWTFDNKDIYNTTVLDKSGNGNNGTNNGATKTIGKLGQALSFNKNYVVIQDSNSLDLVNDFTISSWIKPTSYSGTTYRILHKHQAYTFFIYSGAKLTGYNYGNGTYSYSNSSVPMDVWSHVTYIQSSTNGVSFYINGQLDGGNTASTRNAPQNNNPVYIGIDEDLVNYSFLGLMDDVRVYNHVLSAEEIKRLYNQGVGMKVASTPIETCDNEIWYCDQGNVVANTLGDGDYVFVARTNVGSKQWKTSDTACDTPQCGLDGGQLGDNLVSSNAVDFTDYPARDACKAMGGRLPTMTELSSIYDNRDLFGTFGSQGYWSGTEYSVPWARILDFGSGSKSTASKTSSFYRTRCVKGN